MAQNPSHLVAQALQNHVHLISGHRFPHLPSLNLEQAFRYLIDAPTIVKQTAPMSWQYVHPPPDGTAWLEWIAAKPGASGAEYRFASDGYVWADPEQTYRQDFGGYVVEWMSHSLGYRPNYESVASHARTRFHFLQKNPGVNAPPPDPSLWIVHYHQAEQQRMMPIAQLQTPTQMRQIVQERRWLEMQGRIDKRDFMLHDREHWPTVTVPTGNHPQAIQQAMQQQQQQYANQAMMQQQQQMGGIPRFPQQHQQPFPNQGQGGPPAKRPRTSGPGGIPGSSDGAMHDGGINIEEEENQLLDYFDHLTPRDISLARYSQHHRWMEEVFSSPYASSQIVPPDLGLGLMGELKGLTDGILDPPSVDDIKHLSEKEEKAKAKAAKEAQPFTNLKKEQIHEFNRRVEKHLAAGQAEIERMKKEHAEKMAQWKKTNTLMQAEKRLRYATWEGHEDAVPVYRLDVPATNGHFSEEENATQETVEDVVKDVESLLGVKVQAYDDATMVQKGGLDREEVDEAVRNATLHEEKEMLDVRAQQQQQQQQQTQGIMGDAANSSVQHGFNEPQSATPRPPQNIQPQVPNISVGMHSSALQAEQPQQKLDDAQPQAPVQMQHPSILDEMPDQRQPAFDHMDDMDMGDTSLMGMDMDVDTGDIDFVHHDEDELGRDLIATPSQPSDSPAVPHPEEVPPLPVEQQVEAPTAQIEQEEVPASGDGDDLFGDMENLEQQDGQALSPESLQHQEEQGSPPEEVLQHYEPELQVQAEESAIPAMTADASLGNEPDVSATALPSPPPPQSPQPHEEVPANDIEAAPFGINPEEEPPRGGGGDDLFNDGTFDDLNDLGGDDGNDDDGLIDFEGGMDIENSAFGDAFHGVEARTPDIVEGDREGEQGE